MALFNKKKKITDVLEQKKSGLNSFVEKIDSALSGITDMIEELESASKHIDEEVASIDSYCAALNDTKQSLVATKGRNEKVINNFRSLLSLN